VIESCSGCTATLWALIPRHCDRVKSVKISEYHTFLTFSTEYNNS
jgi:hypothetical protein